jgi:hypothetical protein
VQHKLQVFSAVRAIFGASEPAAPRMTLTSVTTFTLSKCYSIILVHAFPYTLVLYITLLHSVESFPYVVLPRECGDMQHDITMTLGSTSLEKI